LLDERAVGVLGWRRKQKAASA